MHIYNIAEVGLTHWSQATSDEKIKRYRTVPVDRDTDQGGV